MIYRGYRSDDIPVKMNEMVKNIWKRPLEFVMNISVVGIKVTNNQQINEVQQNTVGPLHLYEVC